MANKMKDVTQMEESISIGAMGKVRVLMMEELENAEGTVRKSVSFKRKTQTVPVSVNCGVPRKRQQPHRTSSTNGSNDSRSLHKRVDQTWYAPQRVPMLGSEDISLDRTPTRDEPVKKRSQIVEIVNINCGNSDRGWSDPITNQFRRLSFSRLSD